MPSLHIALRAQEVSGISLANKMIILVDTLFGTTSVVDALGNGASAVVIAADKNEVDREAAKYKEGEYQIFSKVFPQSPDAAALLPNTLHDGTLNQKTLIYHAASLASTLKLVEGAVEIYAGSLLNGPKLAHELAQKNHNPDILFVCAGAGDNFNLQDFFCIGYLIDLFGIALGPGINFSDAALGARYLYRGGRPTESLLTSRIGRAFVQNELEEAVRYAAQRDKYEVVPQFIDEKFVSIG